MLTAGLALVFLRITPNFPPPWGRTRREPTARACAKPPRTKQSTPFNHSHRTQPLSIIHSPPPVQANRGLVQRVVHDFISGIPGQRALIVLISSRFGSFRQSSRRFQRSPQRSQIEDANERPQTNGIATLVTIDTACLPALSIAHCSCLCCMSACRFVFAPPACLDSPPFASWLSTRPTCPSASEPRRSLSGWN